MNLPCNLLPLYRWKGQMEICLIFTLWTSYLIADTWGFGSLMSTGPQVLQISSTAVYVRLVGFQCGMNEIAHSLCCSPPEKCVCVTYGLHALGYSLSYRSWESVWRLQSLWEQLHRVGKDKPGVELLSSGCGPWGKQSPKASWEKET